MFKPELHRVLPCLRWPARGRHGVRTTGLAESLFRHLRRIPGCVDPPRSEQVLGCFIPVCEQAQA